MFPKRRLAVTTTVMCWRTQRKETALTAKKKLAGAFGGVVAIGATIALTAGTFSYFSDSANSTGGGGDVAFGTVKLTPQRLGRHAVRGHKAKPGATVFEADELCFENSGNHRRRAPVAVRSEEQPERVQQRRADRTYGWNKTPALNGTHTLAQNAAASQAGALLEPMEAGRQKCIPITVSIDPRAGNELQGKAGGFSLQADLVQDVAGVTWLRPSRRPPSPRPPDPARAARAERGSARASRRLGTDHSHRRICPLTCV